MTRLFQPKPGVETDIAVFLETVRSRREGTALLSLETSVGAWLRRYAQLQIILARYSEHARAYDEAMLELRTAMTNSGPGTRAMSEADVLAWESRRDLTNRLHLDIETFYMVSKNLLDRIADTFAYCFGVKWTSRGSTHEKLLRVFGRIVRDHGLTLAPSDLPDLVRETRDRIIDYRDQHIEHPDAPGLTQGTLWHPETGVAIASGVFMTSPHAGQIAQRNTEDPKTLMTLIEHYMQAVLAFVTLNLSKSALVARSPE